MVPGSAPDFNTVLDVNTDRSLIAGAGFDSWNYRVGFDLTIPFYSPSLPDVKFTENAEKTFFLISAQLTMFSWHVKILQEIAVENSDVLVLQKCLNQVQTEISLENHEINQKDIRCSFTTQSEFDFPQILEKGVFCLIGRGARLTSTQLLESLAANCIPVVMSDNLILPFSEILDWTLASIQIKELDLRSISNVLKNVSSSKIKELQDQGKHFYKKYFKNIETITLTLLDELNDRVYPHLAKTYLDWNIPANPKATKNPLFLPLIAPKSQGFTAVILTYDRIESLFTLIQKLSVVPSLQKILVIWNNQKKSPPHREYTFLSFENHFFFFLNI